MFSISIGLTSPSRCPAETPRCATVAIGGSKTILNKPGRRKMMSFY